jgi:hypothetical protein
MKAMRLSRRVASAGTIISLVGLIASACVSMQTYDALENDYNQLNRRPSAEIGAQQVHITRLQGAIKVAVNSELLFPSGGWQMPPAAAQTIAKMAPVLAPFVQTQIIMTGYTDNVPIGPELRARRREQPTTIAETGADRRQFPGLAGSQSDPGLGARPRGCRPGRFERHAAGSGPEPPCRAHARRPRHLTARRSQERRGGN